MCGEYSNRFFLIDTSQGSPPHTWRIPAPSSVFHSSVGITSTYVENTKRLYGKVMPKGDHLHIRGEYCLVMLAIETTIGSPPHTWRIPFFESSLDQSLRITSTYVENTKLMKLSTRQTKDHLHIRGEYSKQIPL